MAVLRQSPEQELPLRRLRKECKYRERLKIFSPKIWATQSIDALLPMQNACTWREYIHSTTTKDRCPARVKTLQEQINMFTKPGDMGHIPSKYGNGMT